MGMVNGVLSLFMGIQLKIINKSYCGNQVL